MSFRNRRRSPSRASPRSMPADPLDPDSAAGSSVTTSGIGSVTAFASASAGSCRRLRPHTCLGPAPSRHTASSAEEERQTRRRPQRRRSARSTLPGLRSVAPPGGDTSNAARRRIRVGHRQGHLQPVRRGFHRRRHHRIGSGRYRRNADRECRRNRGGNATASQKSPPPSPVRNCGHDVPSHESSTANGTLTVFGPHRHSAHYPRGVSAPRATIDLWTFTCLHHRKSPKSLLLPQLLASSITDVGNLHAPFHVEQSGPTERAGQQSVS